MHKPNVSIIIVNYNAKDFLRQTLQSIATQKGITTEIIVVDNNSSDDSSTMVKQEFGHVLWVARETNAGFSAGNNIGLKHAQADTILFMNPDATFTKSDDLRRCYDKLLSDDQFGALTPRVNLVRTGGIDATCHRGFPNPWASLTHFSGISKLFPHIPIFNHYTKSYLGYTKEHEIDAIGGMFMLIRRSVGDKVGWWDEDYVFYGEDLDLCYRLHLAGYHNWYYPPVSVLHFKGATTGMTEHSEVDARTTRQVKIWSIQAMELFYRKHYTSIYPFFINWLVFLGIRLLKFRRLSMA